jgi:uncharacterized protein YndB with AHSA1/START domain
MCNPLVAHYPFGKTYVQLNSCSYNETFRSPETGGRPMIERRMTLPASTEEVWKALTDPEILSSWFEADVQWELTPGGDIAVIDGNGNGHTGIVKTVTEGSELQFEWWPDENDHQVSEVTYTLEPTEADQTLLTVTERPVPDAQMSAAPTDSWNTGDDMLFRLWARTAGVTATA